MYVLDGMWFPLQLGVETTTLERLTGGLILREDRELQDVFDMSRAEYFVVVRCRWTHHTSPPII